jgi:hypothetical protein
VVGVIRAVSPHTLWRFEDVTYAQTHGIQHEHIREEKERGATDENKKDGESGNGGQGRTFSSDSAKRYTKVEVECIVDSKGSIPAWLINFMQKQWPTKALTAFNRLVKSRQHSDSSTSSQSGDVQTHARAAADAHRSDSSPGGSAGGFWSGLTSSGSAALSSLSGSGGLTEEEQKKGHDGRERAKTKPVEPFKPVLHW